MNKGQLINQIANKTRVSSKIVRVVLNAFFETTSESLLRKEHVTIAGFGAFMVVNRKSRVGRNPVSGERVEIPSRTVVVFKSGQRLMKDMNE